MNHTLAMIVTLLYIVIIATLVIKKYNSVFMFLISGMMILLLSATFDGGSIMGDKTTGNTVIDVFVYVANTFKSDVSGVGLTLMMVAGYVVYMSHIGVSMKSTYLAIKPLSKVKNPYIVLDILFIIGTLLKLVITSRAGLAMLLMAIVFPILTSLGISKLSAATVMIVCSFVDWGPNDSSVIFAAENVVGMPMMSYFLTYREKAAAVLILICAVFLPICLKHMDKKDAPTGSATVEMEMPRNSSCPTCCAVPPVVPLVLITVFSFIPSIKMDVVTAGLLGLSLVFVLEPMRRRDRKEVANDFDVAMKAMGNSFASVVSIPIGAAVFTETIKLLGGITIISNVLTSVRSTPIITMALMSMIAFSAGMFLGSSNASWYVFGPLVPDVTAQMGVSTATIALPTQLSSNIGRCMSPVAGVVIAISGIAELGIMDIVKQRSVPAIVMFACNVIASYVIV